MRIEMVEPAGVADLASRVLREAWPPPALDYSPEYLNWQFGFPGAVPARTALAFADGEAVGFIGTTPRRVRFHGAARAVMVVSFAAVRPAYRGRGLLQALYACLLDCVRRDGDPVLTFALVESAGQRGLERAYAAAGFTLHSLGTFPTYSYLSRGAATDITPTAGPPGSFDFPDDDTLWSDPTVEQWGHYSADPRPRALSVAATGAGPAVAAAIVSVPVVTAQGIQTVPVLDCCFTPHPTAAGLKAILDAASHGPNGSAVVSVPNLRGADAATIRAAGLRQTAPGFVGYVCAADPEDPILGAATTNLEIV